MRRTSFIGLCAFLLSIVSLSAHNAYPPTHIPYRGMGEVGIGFAGDLDSSLRIEVSTTHSWMATPELFIGGGVAFFSPANGQAVTLPVYASLRAYLSSSPYPPTFFIEGRGGYSVTGQKGLYLSPRIGITLDISSQLALDLMAGLHYLSTPHRHSAAVDITEQKHDLHPIGNFFLSVGLLF